MKVHLRSLLDNVPHPLAAKSFLEFTPQNVAIVKRGTIQSSGEKLGMLFSPNNFDSFGHCVCVLMIWNWQSGDFLAVSMVITSEPTSNTYSVH